MDLSGYIAESGIFILGLRTTNIALEKILTVKKVVISDTDNADINVIYSLGKHHSTAPPKLDDLPFDTLDSELFKFPVPDFSASYKEIEIIKSQELGSHMLLIGKVLNHKQIRNKSSSLHHIHYFQFCNSNYQELN